MIQPRGRAILQANCIACHEALTHEIAVNPRGELDCVHCHATVGHGERAGLGGPLHYPHDPKDLARASTHAAQGE